MPLYSYVARNRDGQSQRGSVESASPSGVAQELRSRGLLVLDVEETRAAVKPPAPDTSLPLLGPRSFDVEVSLQQISVMLRSGLTLLNGLRVVSLHAQRKAMRRVWSRVAERIEEGSSFADSLSRFRCFPRLVVELVRLGEQTGTLDDVLAKSAESMQRRRELRSGIMTALIYPLIVAASAIGVAIFIVVSLLPKIVIFLKAFGRKLPPMTQLMADITYFLEGNLTAILMLTSVGVGALIFLYQIPGFRFWIDRIMLRVPLFGYVLRLAGTVTFARGLGIMLASGGHLIDGLRAVETLLANRYQSWRVSMARERVVVGSSLAESLNTDPNTFVPMLSSMISVGETAGTLDVVLAEVTTFHENHLKERIKRLSALIEPSMIIIVGGIVGFVYLSLFMAIYAVAAPR
jgi:type IV pilus assembly protein PilC